MSDFNQTDWQRTIAMNAVASLRELFAAQGAPNGDAIVARGAATAAGVTEAKVRQWMKEAGI